MANNWQISGWVQRVFGVEETAPPEPVSLPPPKRPSLSRLPTRGHIHGPLRTMPLSQVVELAVDPFSWPSHQKSYEIVVRDYLRAVFVDKDYAKAEKIRSPNNYKMWEVNKACERGLASYAIVRLSKGLTDVIPEEYPLTAYIYDQREAPPEFPILRNEMVNFKVSDAIPHIMLYLDHFYQGYYYMTRAELCLEAIFVDRNYQIAKELGRKLPMWMLVVIDAELRIIELRDKYRFVSTLMDSNPLPAFKNKKNASVSAPKLTPEKRAEALRMRSEGKSNAEIARAIGVSRSTIARLKY